MCAVSLDFYERDEVSHWHCLIKKDIDMILVDCNYGENNTVGITFFVTYFSKADTMLCNPKSSVLIL